MNPTMEPLSYSVYLELELPTRREVGVGRSPWLPEERPRQRKFPIDTVLKDLFCVK